MIKIIQKENKVLRQKAKEVPPEEIKSTKIQKIISDMKEALDSQNDGVAIAAPQIAQSLRIFVVSGKVSTLLEIVKKSKDKIDIDPKDIKKEAPDEVFINPKIVKSSKEKEDMDEGCLSVRWLYGKVKRSKRVSIEALDEKGKVVKRGASGLLAQIFQHETDHLDGILFIDKAKDLEELPPPDLRKK